MAGGFCGLLVQVGGDLDYLATWLNVPRWSNHAKPCGLCPATFRGTNSWMDNRPDAGWLEAGLSCDQWVSSCPLFNVPGVDGTNISPDYMHNMFLGWLQYLYGSILYLLVFVLLAGSPLSKLSQVEAFIRSHQKNNDVKYKYKPRLTKLSMFLKKLDIHGSGAEQVTLWAYTMLCWMSGRRICRRKMCITEGFDSFSTSTTRLQIC